MEHNVDVGSTLQTVQCSIMQMVGSHFRPVAGSSHSDTCSLRVELGGDDEGDGDDDEADGDGDDSDDGDGDDDINVR